MKFFKKQYSLLKNNADEFNMSKVNLNAVKEHVSTQYGDFTGVIQIDGHSNVTSIYELCNDNGFSTNDIFIVGFGFGESTIDGVGKRNEIGCTILYLNKADYGNSFDEIQQVINTDGILKVKKKTIYMSYSKIGKYIKRFDFLTFTEMARNVQEIEIEES